MNNKQSFISDKKYENLSDKVKLDLWELDKKLSENYCYNGIWRNDDECGGKVFIFELPEHFRKRNNVKSLVTLRPQNDYLNIEVYWGDKDKHLYKSHKLNGELDDELFEDVSKKFNKIGIK